MASKKSRNDGREAYDVFLSAPNLGMEMQVGTLRHNLLHTALAPSFEYDAAWLSCGQRFMRQKVI